MFKNILEGATQAHLVSIAVALKEGDDEWSLVAYQ